MNDNFCINSEIQLPSPEFDACYLFENIFFPVKLLGISKYFKNTLSDEEKRKNFLFCHQQGIMATGENLK